MAPPILDINPINATAKASTTAVVYSCFDFTTITLGSYHGQQHTPSETIERLITRPCNRTITTYDAFRKRIVAETQTSETVTQYQHKSAMTTPAYYQISCPEIELTGLKVSKITTDPSIVICLVLKTSPVAQFLLKLSNYGLVLLKDNGIKYRSYRGFLIEQDSDRASLVIKLRSNSKLNHSLEDKVGQVVDTMVVKVRALYHMAPWQDENGRPTAKEQANLLMALNLVRWQ